MAKSKPIISKAKANKLIKQLAESKAAKRSPYKILPDGFVISAEEVRKLLSHPEAAYFVIQFGLKLTTKAGVTTENLTPILCTARGDYSIIEGRAKSPAGDLSVKVIPQMAAASDGGEDMPAETGDYLDEVQHWPPPKN
jgi:hypothetical protein